MKKDVMILAGAGQIGMAIARRMGYGKKIIVGDKKAENARTGCRDHEWGGALTLCLWRWICRQGPLSCQ